jgi:membrane-bound lytic murein transglycosylase B
MLAIIARSTFVLGLASACPALAPAAQCGQAPGGFDAWLASFKQEAAAQGISQRAITTALTGATYDPAVIARDRRQGVFNQSFEEFSGRMVPPRLNKGANMMRQYAGTLTRIEQQFGVPRARS